MFIEGGGGVSEEVDKLAKNVILIPLTYSKYKNYKNIYEIYVSVLPWKEL